MRASSSGRRRPLHLVAAVLASIVAGYVLAISLAKAGAPRQTVYDLPHGFLVTEPTFLPSALPGPTMTSGNRLDLFENSDAIFPAMLAAIASGRPRSPARVPGKLV